MSVNKQRSQLVRFECFAIWFKEISSTVQESALDIKSQHFIKLYNDFLENQQRLEEVYGLDNVKQIEIRKQVEEWYSFCVATKATIRLQKAFNTQIQDYIKRVLVENSNVIAHLHLNSHGPNEDVESNSSRNTFKDNHQIQSESKFSSRDHEDLENIISRRQHQVSNIMQSSEKVNCNSVARSYVTSNKEMHSAAKASNRNSSSAFQVNDQVIANRSPKEKASNKINAQDQISNIIGNIESHSSNNGTIKEETRMRIKSLLVQTTHSAYSVQLKLEL